METIIQDIRLWYTKNLLKCNDSKTEVLIMLSKHFPDFQKLPVTVGESSIMPKTHVKNLGVILDQNLNMTRHVNHVVKTAFLKLREISYYRRYLSKEALKTVVHAYVTSRIDFCNSLLIGLPNTLLCKLQSVLNAAARLVSGKRKYDHITPVLMDLHWLPIRQRIKFKLLLLVFKSLNGMAPDYMRKKLLLKNDNGLRSSGQNILVVPKANKKSYGDRRFSVAGPKHWNHLPKSLRMASSLDTFKSRLKTLLFIEAYGQ